MSERWTPDSWRAKPVQQVPTYPDPAALKAVEEQLAGFPPLVFAGEARKLKRALAKVAAGEAFLLQGGDCAESFAEHSADNIRDFFRVFLQMAVVLTFAGASPVVKVGRIAGQFAKPRSAPTETSSTAELPSYRGDIVNDIAFTPEARTPDPRRQLEAYRQSAATLNLLRAFATGGYANLENAHRWMLGFVKDCPQSSRYRELAERITETLDFMRAIGIDPETHPEMRIDRFLHQPRGAAARLRAGDDPRRFDVGRLVRHLGPHALDRRPHAPAGPRPCRVHARHQEPDRPEMRPVAHAGRAPQLIDLLNPENEPGRLTLICRFGADKVFDHLPALVRAVKREGRVVVWSCDPDARQHHQGRLRLQDPAVRGDHGRGPQLLRRAPGGGARMRAACTSR